MTYDDFVIELNKAGLTVRRFAGLMGMQLTSISNNKKKDDVPVHLTVIVSLLAKIASHDIDYGSIFVRLDPVRKNHTVALKSENSPVTHKGFWSWIDMTCRPAPSTEMFLMCSAPRDNGAYSMTREEVTHAR